jgi:HSP20 family molecular chaperone IbpA
LKVFYTNKGFRVDASRHNDHIYKYSDVYYGDFSRWIDFEFDSITDNISARYENGQLIVTVMRNENGDPIDNTHDIPEMELHIE